MPRHDMNSMFSCFSMNPALFMDLAPHPSSIHVPPHHDRSCVSRVTCTHTMVTRCVWLFQSAQNCPGSGAEAVPTDMSAELVLTWGDIAFHTACLKSTESAVQGMTGSHIERGSICFALHVYNKFVFEGCTAM